MFVAKSLALCAIIGSAAAYVPMTMSLQADRRAVIGGAAAAAAAAALPLAAQAKDAGLRAPIVEIFDARGCDTSYVHQEYKGRPSGAMEDEQCVKVSMKPIEVSEVTAGKLRQQFLGLKQTAINVEQISQTTRQY